MQYSPSRGRSREKTTSPASCHVPSAGTIFKVGGAPLWRDFDPFLASRCTNVARLGDRHYGEQAVRVRSEIGEFLTSLQDVAELFMLPAWLERALADLELEEMILWIQTMAGVGIPELVEEERRAVGLPASPHRRSGLEQESPPLPEYSSCLIADLRALFSGAGIEVVGACGGTD